MGAWHWQTVRGPVAELVGASIPDPAARMVRVVEADTAAFVLGSTQVAPEVAVAPMVRRRSGGGGVLLVPGDLLWVDIVVPRTDRWWDDDVGRAAHPVGEAWATALGTIGMVGEVHRGPLVSGPCSSALCFAGLGPGEVTVDGRKVVGIAQRRTRAGACFQCAVPMVAPGATSVEAAGLEDEQGVAARAHLAATAGAVAGPSGVLIDALRTVLPPS